MEKYVLCLIASCFSAIDRTWFKQNHNPFLHVKYGRDHMKGIFDQKKHPTYSYNYSHISQRAKEI
jgi:hypothetical protein